MAKPKISMEVSERDKKLLLLLLSVLIVAAAYIFGYDKFSEQKSQYEKELKELKTKEAELKVKESNIEEYIENTEKYKLEYNGIISRYGNVVTQPQVIEFLNKVERVTGAWIKSVSFTGTTSVYTFGQIPSSNPSGGSAYTTDMAGYKTALTVAYEAEYSQWKQMIEFINSYYSKNTIENITMSYSGITGRVSGTMTLALYAIIGSGITYEEPEFNIDTGSDNIFESDVLTGTTEELNGDYILGDYDYYILLNPSTASINSCVVGKKDDVSQDTVLSKNSEQVQEVTISFSGSNGSYKVNYDIEGTGIEQEFVPRKTMDLLIMSSGRLSDEDLAGINLSVENSSDMTLNIKIFNDDEKSRVNFKKTTGDIVLY